jgi:hypothetical protein
MLDRLAPLAHLLRVLVKAPLDGHGRPATFAWSTNYLIDVQAAVIVDVEPSTVVRNAEVDSTKPMIERTEARFGLKPRRLIGDNAYGTAEMLGWMVEEKAIRAACVSLGERRAG